MNILYSDFPVSTALDNLVPKYTFRVTEIERQMENNKKTTRDTELFCLGIYSMTESPESSEKWKLDSDGDSNEPFSSFDIVLDMYLSDVTMNN